MDTGGEYVVGPSGAFVVPLVKLLLLESATFSGVALVRLLWLYLNPRCLPMASKVLQCLFMVASVVHLLLIFTPAREDELVHS